ncbi:MAG: hypothetical protein ACT6U0_16500 [Shinella sp.]|uniref:hypothetical protein n=1 Tax=Shinella sp. TaxID=1870904 RepID=UPI0040357FF4
MTVLTDLSASMFAACFMILLIFLSLVQKGEPASPAPRAFEAKQAFMVTRQQVLAPAAMIDHLFAHGRSGTSLDLFADRVEISNAGRKEVWQLSGSDLVSRLADLTPVDDPVRLQVFSHAFYNQVAGALEAGGTAFTELTVPAALRDPERQSLAWVPAFLQLRETSADRQSFRIGLAALLHGAAEHAPGTGATAIARPTTSPTQSLLDRLADWIDRVTGIFFLLAGFACVAWIERRRFSAVHDT